jgi:hypothetical protein
VGVGLGVARALCEWGDATTERRVQLSVEVWGRRIARGSGSLGELEIGKAALEHPFDMPCSIVLGFFEVMDTSINMHGWRWAAATTGN